MQLSNKSINAATHVGQSTRRRYVSLQLKPLLSNELTKWRQIADQLRAQGHVGRSLDLIAECSRLYLAGVPLTAEDREHLRALAAGNACVSDSIKSEAKRLVGGEGYD